MPKEPCGINHIGGFCPFTARPDDPLCADHATASHHGAAFVGLDGERRGGGTVETRRNYRRTLGRLRAAGATLPAHVEER